MCIISIIMIALCIPNQIQIANAAGGDNESDLKVYEIDSTGKKIEWTDGVNLDLFPKREGTNKWNVMPGSTGAYKFCIENNWGYKATCEISLIAEITKREDLNTSPDETYPITYQLYKRENDELTKLLGEGKNPLNYPDKTVTKTVEVKNGETGVYVLEWKFEDIDSTFKGGNYHLYLSVNAKQETNSDNNTPDNPNNGNKDDTSKGDNNNSTDNGNNGNNSSNSSGSNSNGSQNGNNSTSNNNKGNNTNNGSDDSKGNESSNNKQENNQNNKQNNLNIDKTSSKETGSIETSKKKVNTSDITTPVIYVAFMILMFGLILLVKSRKEN